MKCCSRSIFRRSRITVAVAVLLAIVSGFTYSQTKPATPVTPAQPSATPPPRPQPKGEEVDPDDVIRVETNLVNSPVLVIGRNGKFVPTLRRDDFQVFEDGIKQDIAYFAPVENPITVAILLDTSRSTLFNLVEIQDAAIAFVNKLRPQDQAVVITFADEVKVLAEPTSDRDVLHRAIRNSRPGGDTRVYDAIEFTLNKQLESPTGRRAVLLFSDGVDNASSSATAESTLQKLRTSDVLFYPIKFETYSRMKTQTGAKQRSAPTGSGFSDQDYLRADAYLNTVAELSSTGVYPAREISDLDRAVASIVDELHNEYSVGYYPRTPGQPGQVRRIEVRVNQRQLVVRARTGYVVDQNGAPLRVVTKPVPTTLAGEGSLPIPLDDTQEPKSLSARWVCKGPNVPTDYVVVQEGLVAHCPPSSRDGDRTNAWFIKKPGASETLCKGFIQWNGREIPGAPVPTGYVVVGETSSAKCATAGADKNAWNIRLPRQTDVICKGFQIPRRYVVVGEQVSSECPVRSGKNALMIRGL